jgi:hypothetical protein
MDGASGLDGAWAVTIKTPIGTLAVRYEFTGAADAPAGSASYQGEQVPLRDIAVTEAVVGQRITWRQAITKPIRLNLDFDVVVDGDTMTGHSRAGRLPRSAVSGRRCG